jgi:hypothetical protein
LIFVLAGMVGCQFVEGIVGWFTLVDCYTWVWNNMFEKYILTLSGRFLCAEEGGVEVKCPG